jgi:hypothetical protein
VEFGDDGLAVRLTFGLFHHLPYEKLRELLIALAKARPLIGVRVDQRSNDVAE